MTTTELQEATADALEGVLSGGVHRECLRPRAGSG